MKLSLKLLHYFTLILLLSSCRGFYEPITLDLETPDGPPEYKAGWHAGCRTALSLKNFANAFVYNADYGNGIYQHDPVFQTAWGQGFFSCKMHISGFVSRRAMEFGPLE